MSFSSCRRQEREVVSLTNEKIVQLIALRHLASNLSERNPQENNAKRKSHNQMVFNGPTGGLRMRLALPFTISMIRGSSSTAMNGTLFII